MGTCVVAALVRDPELGPFGDVVGSYTGFALPGLAE